MVGGDRKLLLFLHGTTVHKISVAAYRQQNMKELYPFIFSKAKKRKSPFAAFPFFKFTAELDSFFTTLYGALQAWGREICEIIGLELKPKEMYFPIITDKAISEYPKLGLSRQLFLIRKSGWFDYLNQARNRIEHGGNLLYHVGGGTSLYLADKQWPTETVATYDNKLQVINQTDYLMTSCSSAIDSCAIELEKLLFRLPNP